MIWNSLTHVLNRMKISGFYVRPIAENEIFLTFDDGPNRKTPELFSFLDHRNIAATHFWLFNGEQPEFYRNDSALQRIGIHGYNHVRYSKLNEAETENEIVKSLTRLNEAEIKFDSYFRSPYGSVNKFIGSICKKHHLKMIYWSHILADYKSSFDPASVRHSLNSIKPGSIIVLHDKEQYISRVCQTVRNIQDLANERNLKLTCLPF